MVDALLKRSITTVATLHVADVNLIAPTNARRALVGLACMAGEKIGLTPEVVQSGAGVIGHEAVRREARRQRRAGRELGIQAALDIRSRVSDWFTRRVDDPDGPYRVVCSAPSEKQRAVNLEARFPVQTFHDANLTARDSDRRILAEALAGNADMVVTNNLRSINHARFNRWCEAELGRNTPFVMAADAGFHQVVMDHNLGDRELVLAALAMCVSDRPRSDTEEWEGVRRLLMIAEQQIKYPAYVAGTAVMTSGATWRAAVLAEAREIKDQPPWVQCRRAEAERVRISRSAQDGPIGGRCG